MTDANALRKDFAEDKGWTKDGVRLLLNALANRCILRSSWQKQGMLGAACSVELDAYQRVCDEYPHFSKKQPEGLCVDHVVGHALSQLVPENVDGLYGHELVHRRQSVALFFDRNEPYRHQIYRVWRPKPWHRRSWPLKLVSSVGEADRESSAAIQAADFLAWHMNRDVASQTGDLRARMMTYFASGGGDIRHYDYAELRDVAQRWDKQHGYKSTPEHA